jgi:hypothetical protein
LPEFEFCYDVSQLVQYPKVIKAHKKVETKLTDAIGKEGMFAEVHERVSSHVLSKQTARTLNRSTTSAFLSERQEYIL